jgi:hypothetical protein
MPLAVRGLFGLALCVDGSHVEASLARSFSVIECSRASGLFVQPGTTAGREGYDADAMRADLANSFLGTVDIAAAGCGLKFVHAA